MVLGIPLPEPYTCLPSLRHRQVTLRNSPQGTRAKGTLCLSNLTYDSFATLVNSSTCDGITGFRLSKGE
jgi:hypothetical protein